MEPDVNEEETVESSNACQYDNEWKYYFGFANELGELREKEKMKKEWLWTEIEHFLTQTNSLLHTHRHTHTHTHPHTV